MKTIAIIAGTLTVLGSAYAQFKPDPTMIGSVSGQFFVNSRTLALSANSIQLAREPNMVTLEPPLLAVSCERIKEELLRQLEMRDQWQGKIFVTLHPAWTANDPITIRPEKFGTRWSYGVQMPDAVDRTRIIEAIVRVCLLEIANRNAVGRSSEIPEWLAEGFSQQLLAASEIRLVLPPPASKENGMSINRVSVEYSDAPDRPGRPSHKLNPLAGAISTLRTNAPLTFDQLSWPTDEQLNGDSADVFRCSSQLLVNELLRMKNGPASMRNMLAELPGYLNWQFAFMDAYRGAFKRPLDVEKWWALELVQFSGRDLLHLWTPEESWNQLDAVFHFPIQVQIGEGPPMRTEISFQTILRGWSRARQLQVLQKKLVELDLLRMRLSPEYIPIVENYERVLQEYYKKRSASTKIFHQGGPLPDKLLEEALQQLDALDLQRAKMKPEPPGASATQAAAILAP
jgi:hypothetical protein